MLTLFCKAAPLLLETGQRTLKPSHLGCIHLLVELVEDDIRVGQHSLNLLPDRILQAVTSDVPGRATLAGVLVIDMSAPVVPVWLSLRRQRPAHHGRAAETALRPAAQGIGSPGRTAADPLRVV